MELNKKRTSVDFSKHELITKEIDGLGCIHHLKQPNTIVHNVRFMNIGGVLVVTGDFGNWMFCREFVPTPKEYVSDGYWCEKLQISSSQNPYEFDGEATRKRADEIISEYGDDKELVEYLEECKSRTCENDEIYRAYAYQNYPNNYDYEIVPYEKRVKFWLQVVFDAFEEICKRLTP